jgi:hypothetical protein
MCVVMRSMVAARAEAGVCGVETGEEEESCCCVCGVDGVDGDAIAAEEPFALEAGVFIEADEADFAGACVLDMIRVPLQR